MKTRFEVICKGDDLVQLSIYNMDVPDIANVSVTQCFTKKTFDAAGNIIDKNVIPYQVCHSLMKSYQMKLHEELLRISYFIFDDELKNKVIEYARDMVDGKIGLVTEKEFFAFIDNFKKCITNWYD